MGEGLVLAFTGNHTVIANTYPTYITKLPFSFSISMRAGCILLIMIILITGRDWLPLWTSAGLTQSHNCLVMDSHVMSHIVMLGVPLQTGRQAGTQANSQADKQADKQADEQTDKQADKQHTSRQTNRQISNIQAGRRTDR